VDPEEVESIVQRSNEKLAAETLKMQQVLEARIRQLESKTAWSEPLMIPIPGSTTKAKTQALHGPLRGLESEFDNVATTLAQNTETRPQPDACHGGHGADLSAAQEPARGKAEVRERDESEAPNVRQEDQPREHTTPDEKPSAGEVFVEMSPGAKDLQDASSQPGSEVILPWSYTKCMTALTFARHILGMDSTRKELSF